MAIFVFQHTDAEHLALLGDILMRRRIPVRYFPLHRGFSLPRPDELWREGKGLVVLGGPMGVYETDKYPWMVPEMGIIGEALRRDFPVYGLCLGSQLMAGALGARVRPGEEKKEIGWFPVSVTAEGARDPLLAGEGSVFTVFQWHGDTFDLPRGAALLASSGRYPRQAFRSGRRGYAFQFHLEVGQADVRRWLQVFAGDLASPRSDADPAEILERMPACLDELNARAERLFGRWLSLAGYPSDIS
ncbi:MAG: glutamine amidotransferase [Candidatus Tectomicrobia bacterium]|nr:glutamine amidotransferase [Candidatus Tectomicrobia bacterium]